jgi:hypothetical protein
MNSEDFDYGSLDSSSPKDKTPNEHSDIFESFDTEPQQRSSRTIDGLNIRVMIQVVCAVILLAVAGTILGREAWMRRTRDAAVRQIDEANSRRDYLSVIKAAEDFLTHPSTNGSRDEREATVKKLYGQALVHWVAQYPTKLDANAHECIARYKRLVKSPDK